MSLSVTEQERILETVHQSLIGFIYDQLSGIPEIREQLHAQGLKLKIGLEAGIESDAPAALDDPGQESAEAGLDDWRGMGISIDDLRDVAQTERLRYEEAAQALEREIRDWAPRLSPRGRNYSWGWLNLHYPEAGVGASPSTVEDERFRSLSSSGLWQSIVETALEHLKLRRDRKEALGLFLATLHFAHAHT